MARLALNKSSLSGETRRLKTYRRFLPSLDLKRKQLIAERAKAARTLVQTKQALAELDRRVRDELPMACNQDLDLTELVTLRELELIEENVVGVRLPTVGRIETQTRAYSLLARPHWVDSLAERLREAIVLRIRLQVDLQRLALLENAVQKVTQRVNLFDKVLIPRTEANIKKIRIALSDAERAAVVRAKIAKRKRAEVA